MSAWVLVWEDKEMSGRETYFKGIINKEDLKSFMIKWHYW